MTLRYFTTLIASTCVLMAGAATAETYGTDWNGIHKDKGDFGLDVDAFAGISAAAGSSADCDTANDNYDNCVDIYTASHSSAIAEVMCKGFESIVTKICALDYDVSFAAQGYLDSEAELMGDDVDLLYLYGGGGLDTDGEVWGKVTAQLGGVTVESWSDESSVSVSLEKELASIPVFGVDGGANVNLGGIKIKVEAEAGGTMGLTLSGTVTTSKAEATLTPSVTVGASASASVDVVVASFGVSGDLTLIEVSAPATTWIEYVSGTTFEIGFGMSLGYEALVGKLKVWAKILGTKYSTKLIDFDGLSDEWTLVETSTNITL